MSPSPETSAAAEQAAPARSLLENPVAWVVLLAVYVVLGVLVRSIVLNWIVGPLFPLVFLHLLPRALRTRRNA